MNNNFLMEYGLILTWSINVSCNSIRSMMTIVCKCKSTASPGLPCILDLSISWTNLHCYYCISIVTIRKHDIYIFSSGHWAPTSINVSPAFFSSILTCIFSIFYPKRIINWIYAGAIIICTEELNLILSELNIPDKW